MTADEAEKLWTKTNALFDQGSLDEAEAEAWKLVQAFESSEGVVPIPVTLNYGMALGIISNIILNRRGGTAAVKVFTDALDRLESQPKSVRRGFIYLNLARLLQRGRNSEQAAQAAATAIQEADVAARSFDLKAVGLVLEGTTILRELHAQSDVVPLLQAILTAAEKTSGNAGVVSGAISGVIVRLHDHLTHFLLASHRYQDALPHAEFTFAAKIERFGSDSTEAGEAALDYGLALDQCGSYTQAEVHYRKALKIFSRHRGLEDDSVKLVRFNLAELSRVKGDLEEAERQFRLLESDDRQQHPDPSDRNARILTNFGLVLAGLHEYEEAHEKLSAALEIIGNTDGRKSPRSARVLLALGQLAQLEDQHDEAVRLLKESADIMDASNKPGSGDYARFQAALSGIHLSSSLAAAAEVRKWIDRAKQRLGANHPEIFTMLHQLVFNEFKHARDAGDAPEWRDELRLDLEEADKVGQFLLVEQLSSLGSAALAEVLDERRKLQDLYVSLVLSEPQPSQQSVDRAWRFVTRYRSAETTALRLRSRRYVQYDPSARRSSIADLKEKILQIDLTLRRDGPSDQLRSDRDRYANELADVEFSLAASTNQQRLDLEFMGDDAPVLSLDQDSAILLVTQYTRFVEHDEGYAVFVVRSEPHAVQLIDLGDGASIDELIQQYRDAVVREGRFVVPNQNAWREPGLALTCRLFDPIHQLLDGVRKLKVLTDGKVALIPLCALPRPEGGYLFNGLDITYDVSLRALGQTMFEEDSGIDGPPVVVGAPEYSLGIQGGEDLQKDARFGVLTHSEAECRDIAHLLGVEPTLGKTATEEAFLSLQSPEILHVATHGFFLSSEDAGIEPALPKSLTLRRGIVGSLDRAGLALAGANDYLDGRALPQGMDDGIVYASEIADCDFMRTDLVTLSACQTGLGDIALGDGVHGLQRAFLSAGARTIVCSLWEVPDKPTRDLFIRFYGLVLAGKQRGEAFHETVRELAAEYPAHPVAWGGFVLLGVTEQLARFTARRLNIRSIQWPKMDADDPSPSLRAEKLIATAKAQARKGEIDDALATLNDGLLLKGVPAPLKAGILYERAGIKRRAGRVEDALRDYAALNAMPDLEPQLRRSVIFDAGTSHLLLGQWADAVNKYTAFLESRPSAEDVAMALVNRAGAYWNSGDEKLALADLDAVIEGVHMPSNQRAKALVSRAKLKLKSDDGAGAIADADRVITGFDAYPDDLAGAYLIRGMAFEAAGNEQSARQEYQSAVGVRDLSPERLKMIEEMIARLDDADRH